MLTVEDALAKLLTELHGQYDEEPGVQVLAQPGENLITDWCGPNACAMVYARLDTMGVSTQAFPETDVAASGRTGPLAASFHLGVARCVAVIDEQGNPPSAEQQTLEAGRFINDARRLRKAIACLVEHNRPHLSPGKTLLVGRWTPQGPLGGCAGGYWPLTLRAS